MSFLSENFHISLVEHVALATLIRTSPTHGRHFMYHSLYVVECLPACVSLANTHRPTLKKRATLACGKVLTHRLIPKIKDIVHTRPLVSTKVVTDSFKSGARADFMKAEDILDLLDRFVLFFTQLLLEVG